MFWLKYIHGLLKTLNADTSPNEMAAGVAFGAMIGLLPKVNLLALALWLIVFFFRVNFGMATASIVIFAIGGSLTDPWTESLGYTLLTGMPTLRPLWVTLYNTPIVPFSAFNNTLVMGNFVVGTLLWVPIFLLARHGVVTYRLRWRERLMQTRLMQAFKASSVFDVWNRWWNR